MYHTCAFESIFFVLFCDNFLRVTARNPFNIGCLAAPPPPPTNENANRYEYFLVPGLEDGCQRNPGESVLVCFLSMG